MVLRVICVVAIIVFGLFTFWQFNDLDQYGTKWWQGWVLFYLVAAAAAIVALFKHLPVWVYVLGAVGSLGAAIYRSMSIEWGNTVLYNEQNPAGNESGGLLIVAIWFAYLAAAAWGEKRNAI